MHKLRQKASGRRVRYQSEGGFDLDLSYITDRVIAMPIPSEQKLTTILKNNINEVIRFLEQLHANHYRVYNLCLEGKYDYEKFKGRVSGYQFADNSAPTLRQIVDCVNDAADWLDAHPRNVCVVHCSNGKGRTGVMVACLLLKIGACSTSSEALQLFANRRTVDGKVVVKHPSQLRYVHLYDQLRKNMLLFADDEPSSPDRRDEANSFDFLQLSGREAVEEKIERNIPRIITGIRLSSAPQFRRRGGCDPWFSVDQKGKRIFFSPPLKGVKSTESVYFSQLRIIVEADIKLDFFHKNFKTKMFSCSLHTSAFRASAISLPKRELDLAWKDKGNKHFPANFKLEIFLAAAPDFDDLSDSNGESNGLVGSNQNLDQGDFSEKSRSNTSASAIPSASASARTTRASENEPLTNTLTRMRASAQLETVSVIGSRCARCREVLGPQDFYLEVSGVSIHWDCLQCNECGRVFGEAVGGGARDSCVLMREDGGIGCVHCGDFRNFFPACARCGEPVTSEEDCCVSVPAATTYWHVACFSCVRCNASLLFSDEDALWRIEPTTGMPICFYHSSSHLSSSLGTSIANEDFMSQPSAPPSSPASGFFGTPQRQSLTNQKENMPSKPINIYSAHATQSLSSSPRTASSSPRAVPSSPRAVPSSPRAISSSPKSLPLSPRSQPMQSLSRQASQPIQSSQFAYQSTQQPSQSHQSTFQNPSAHAQLYQSTQSYQSTQPNQSTQTIATQPQRSFQPQQSIQPHQYILPQQSIQPHQSTQQPSQSHQSTFQSPSAHAQLHQSHQSFQPHQSVQQQITQNQNHQTPQNAHTHLQKSPSQDPQPLQDTTTTTTTTATKTKLQRVNSLPKQQCAGCGKEIGEGQEALFVGGSNWHVGCLTCAHCSLSFSTEHRAVAVNGKMYCREDFEKLFGVLCDRCRNVIEPGAGYFNTGTKQYHTTCLSCSVCEKTLSAGTFFVRNDFLLCEQHKNYSPTQSVSSVADPQLSRVQMPPPPIVASSTDSGEALCHAVAALIKTAKEVLMTLDDFDKKEFVGLAKHLALTGREYSSSRDTNTSLELKETFNKAHEQLLRFCATQLRCPPPHSTQPTCESLEHSRIFLLPYCSKMRINNV